MNTQPQLSMLPAIQCQTGSGEADAAIIWLHGLGADGHDFEPIVSQLGLNSLSIRFIFPHALAMPITINGGYIMPAWYDIRSEAIHTSPDLIGIGRSAQQVQLLIDRELMHGIAPQRLMMAGFSQGAVMALHCGLRQRPAIGGIIALSGYLATEIPSPTTTPLPIFIGHGVEDPIVPFELGDDAQRRLQTDGHRVAWHTWPMEHSVCAEEIDKIGAWIRKLLE
ncbi:MAG: carboxylesterase [Mariprofundales bacterium]